MSILLASWHNHYKNSPGSFDEHKTVSSGCQLLDQAIDSYSVRIYHHYFLLLLSSNADTHFYHHAEGRSLEWTCVCWLHTEVVYLPADSHPSQY